MDFQVIEVYLAELDQWEHSLDARNQ
ncbi:hypothetical protein CCACVL1_19798 [Corchorus capsularis]|uniref:Uncharacterized protein n=1 Tax=Corchorus capsularis TaxID=210143 RepID=A0A1R3HES9_COCAP|nr:hypothetical protein CCACVL1_19798 [Corchorus capsularis]